MIKNLEISKESKNQIVYLVDENWINQWMKKTNYKEIITCCLAKNMDIKSIKNKIIYFEEKNKKNKLNIPKILIKNFDNDKDMLDYLTNNSLVLVNRYFIINFDNYNENYFYCTTSKNNLKLNIRDLVIDFNSENNILSIKKINIYSASDNYNLMQILWKPIIMFFYFNEEIINQIKSQYNQKNNENNRVYYINKKSMHKYKDLYNYAHLVEIFRTQKFIQTTHQNIENNYPNLINLIIKKYKEYFEQTSKTILSYIFKFKFNDDYYKIPYKIYISGNKKIKYYEDFEVLSEEIAYDLEKIGIIKKELLIKGEYIAGDNKILFIFS